MPRTQRPPRDLSNRLTAAQDRLARSEPKTHEHCLARAALHRAEDAMARATGAPAPKRRRGGPILPPEQRKPRQPRKRNASGKHTPMEPAERAERDRLAELARSKLHATTGSPQTGTSWAAVAKVLDVNALSLRGRFRSPKVDRALREYLDLTGAT